MPRYARDAVAHGLSAEAITQSEGDETWGWQARKNQCPTRRRPRNAVPVSRVLMKKKMAMTMA